MNKLRAVEINVFVLILVKECFNVGFMINAHYNQIDLYRIQTC